MRKQVTVGCGFISDWSKKWREFFFSQSQSEVIQNPSKRKILSTLKWKPLYGLKTRATHDCKSCEFWLVHWIVFLRAFHKLLKIIQKVARHFWKRRSKVASKIQKGCSKNAPKTQTLLFIKKIYPIICYIPFESKTFKKFHCHRGI